jgi:Uma2 family endonuclease
MAALPDIVGRLTRDDVRRMEEQGLLPERWELIDGELINKMGQNAPHSGVLNLIMAWLNSLFGKRVRCQSPMEVASSDRRSNDPVPDLAVLLEWRREYFQRQPRGEELILVVEIADTSVRLDLIAKANLYARAGVPEYWVIDINGRRVIAHRQLANGAYTQVDYMTEDQSLSLAGSDLLISSFLP